MSTIVSPLRAATARGLRPHRRVWRFLRAYPVFPVLIVIVLIACAIFAESIAPRDPLAGGILNRNIPPSWLDGGEARYLLGTDPLGRDVLSRIIHGARVSMTIAAVVLGIGGTFGTLMGILAGYAGGRWDDLIMRVVDLSLAIPFVLIALVVVIVVGQSFGIVILLLIYVSWGAFARQVRAETLTLKTLDYVALARVAGASPTRIMLRHILPGVINTVMVIGTLRVGQLILTESLLSFLGVGIPAPTPAWGAMISDGRDFIATAWWITFFPGVAIFLTVMAFNFLGDWLRDYFDPRLKQMTS